MACVSSRAIVSNSLMVAARSLVSALKTARLISATSAFSTASTSVSCDKHLFHTTYDIIYIHIIVILYISYMLKNIHVYVYIYIYNTCIDRSNVFLCATWSSNNPILHSNAQRTLTHTK